MTFSQSLDIELERVGWKQRNAIWNLAAFALKRRDYARFDKLMTDFRNSTQRTDAGTETASGR